VSTLVIILWTIKMKPRSRDFPEQLYD